MQQREVIFIALFVFICAVIVSLFIIYLFFRKSKINIFSLRETISNLESATVSLEEKKKNYDEEIYRLIKEEQEIGAETKRKKAHLGEIVASIQKNAHEHDKEEAAYKESIRSCKQELEDLNSKTWQLQALEKNAKEIEKKISDWENVKHEIEDANKKLHDLRAKIDLYSRIDDFREYGFFQPPDYLFETSERYAIEIGRVRDKQKEFIKNRAVIVGPANKALAPGLSFIGKLLDSQRMIVVRAFNIECDFLVSKVSPANFERTLRMIENIANTLEKQMADLRYGFNNDYILLKMEECKLQYQHSLLKKEEAEEQRAIREQIREEQKARKEYEREIALAEKDEHVFLRMLDQAKRELSAVTGEELQKAELRIKHLEMQLAEAVSRAERAKSMAEQTRQGHVYIISNIGSFGENVYKIGLTRRLDPMERIRELGDASVPFSFDIHAMIAADDAPSLERALHIAFDDRRLNAVNMRKEFFHVPLEEIRTKTQEITGGQASFIMTLRADEYYQTQRLKSELSRAKPLSS